MRRFVADLLRGRRPRRFAVGDDDADQLRFAISLRAARPGSTAPREEFVTALHRRLAEQADEQADGQADEQAGEQAGEQPGTRRDRAPAPAHTRRRIVQVTSIAAGAAAVGAGADHLLTRSSGGEQPPTPETLTPNTGQWQTVAASAELPEGAVKGFDLGTVIGFVARNGGAVSAVSGVCTHLGCRLAFNTAADRLDCPCHNASFALTGRLIRYQLAVPPPPLPHLRVREVDGAVQVFVPPRAT
jgi:cytochrome b6-f complex iron-sulfur subunit